MIGLDTNVLVRYLAQDDQAQSSAASSVVDALTEDEPGFISLVVLVELCWVLRRAYRVPRVQVREVVTKLLDAAEIVVQESDAVRAAAAQDGLGADLPDSLASVLGIRAGCRHTVTFDRSAARLPGMRLLDAG